MSYVAIPCLAGYTIYSLLYESHKGWYSFIITTLTSFVYMFGFVRPGQCLMCGFTDCRIDRPNSSRSLLLTISSSPSHICQWRQWYTKPYPPLLMTFLRKSASVLSWQSYLTNPDISFCIKMPFLHRLACFRDDLVFLVFLYQVRSLRSHLIISEGFTAMDISNRPQTGKRIRSGIVGGCRCSRCERRDKENEVDDREKPPTWATWAYG